MTRTCDLRFRKPSLYPAELRDRGPACVSRYLETSYQRARVIASPPDRLFDRTEAPVPGRKLVNRKSQKGAVHRRLQLQPIQPRVPLRPYRFNIVLIGTRHVAAATQPESVRIWPLTPPLRLDVVLAHDLAPDADLLGEERRELLGRRRAIETSAASRHGRLAQGLPHRFAMPSAIACPSVSGSGSMMACARRPNFGSGRPTTTPDRTPA